MNTYYLYLYTRSRPERFLTLAMYILVLSERQFVPYLSPSLSSPSLQDDAALGTALILLVLDAIIVIGISRSGKVQLAVGMVGRCIGRTIG
jgi:hypothetical protein